MPDSVAVLQAVATITRGRKPNVRERQTNSSVASAHITKS